MKHVNQFRHLVLAAALPILGVLTGAQAQMVELFYHDFNAPDGNLDGTWWVMSSTSTGQFCPPDIVWDGGEGRNVLRGVNAGYSQDCLDTKLITRFAMLGSEWLTMRELRIEMRARSGFGWPNQSSITLLSGPDFYVGRVYGEGSRSIDFGVKDHDTDLWMTVEPIGDDVANWHTYAWERDDDGWWTYIRDEGTRAEERVENFHQDLTIVSFDQVILQPLRNESDIAWVRISGVPVTYCEEDLVMPVGVEMQDLNAVLNRWGDPDCE